MIPVGRLAPGNQWDQHLLDLLFDNRLYATGVEFRRFSGYPNTNEGCCLIIPGRYWSDHTMEISKAIRRYKWVLAFRVGDEEDTFDISGVEHDNIRWWVQTPRTDRDYGGARLMPLGFPPHFNMPTGPPVKDTTVFLSGQNTHVRRRECFEALALVKPPKMVQQTEGFTQGMNPDEYALWMRSARVAPCPSGPATPDTFRVWEALEAHTVPIADDLTPGYDSRGYWERLLPGCPFPILTNYDDLPGYVGDVLKRWPANRVTAWWMRRKRTMAHWLREDLEALGAL